MRKVILVCLVFGILVAGASAATTYSGVVAWGDNSEGQCTVPADLSNVAGISAGRCHNLALKSDGTVIAWGDNSEGQCTVPAGLSNVVAISAGWSHNLALKSDGTVVAWGYNNCGQCTVPAGLSNVVAISAGGAGGLHNLALVLVPDPPAASYTWVFPPWDHNPMPTTGEAPLTVAFTDTSTGPPAYWLWNFGDGQASTVQNPTHTFTKEGTYNVTLEVTNSKGSSQTAHTITVLPPKHPIAGFSATPTSGPAPLTVQFTDESSSDITDSWFWEFGDGFTSQAQNPAHTYVTAGTYTVILTAYNKYGSDTVTKANYIAVGSGLVSSATICGIVYDAKELATLDDALVTIRNATGWSSTTSSHSGGYYQFSNLTPGVYTVHGTKPGYASSPAYAVQAYQDTVSTQHIALTVSGVSLTGTCYDAEKGTPLTGTTVTATQGSTPLSNTTSTGKYTLDNFLPSSPITLSASHAGYSHSAITVTPTGDGPITRDLYLIPDSITHSGTALAGLVTSSRDDQAIQGATVSATAGGNHTAFTNPTGFYLIDNLPTGKCGVSATATKYSPSKTYTHTLENGTVTLQNIRLDPSSQAPASAYTPKQVRFTYLSATGTPISGLSVSAVGSSTTAGTWDWFLSLLGLDVSETNIATSTMTGVTGSDGSITFMMLESVYYTVTAANPDLGLSLTSNIYPKEDEYVFTILGSSAPSADTQVSWDFNTVPVNDSYTRLEIAYLDQSNRTQSFRFTVSDEDHVQIHTETLDNTNDISVSYPVENDPGAVVYWGFDATRITTGTETEHIQADQFIRFNGEGSTPFDFGLPLVVRHWMGFLLLICTSLAFGVMFGPEALKFAGPIIGILALALKFIDWLPIGWELAIIIFVLGCLGYLRSVKDERMV